MFSEAYDFWIMAHVFRGPRIFWAWAHVFRGPKILDPGSFFQRPRIFWILAHVFTGPRAFRAMTHVFRGPKVLDAAHVLRDLGFFGSWLMFSKDQGSFGL